MGRFIDASVLLTGVIIVIMVLGCGATYPSTCKIEKVDGAKTWLCGCKELKAKISAHPDKPHPAGTAVWICDGEKLPLTVRSENTGLPQCQE